MIMAEHMMDRDDRRTARRSGGAAGRGPLACFLLSWKIISKPESENCWNVDKILSKL